VATASQREELKALDEKIAAAKARVQVRARRLDRVCRSLWLHRSRASAKACGYSFIESRQRLDWLANGLPCRQSFVAHRRSPLTSPLPPFCPLVTQRFRSQGKNEEQAALRVAAADLKELNGSLKEQLGEASLEHGGLLQEAKKLQTQVKGGLPVSQRWRSSGGQDHGRTEGGVRCCHCVGVGTVVPKGRSRIRARTRACAAPIMLPS